MTNISDEFLKGIGVKMDNPWASPSVLSANFSYVWLFGVVIVIPCISALAGYYLDRPLLLTVYLVIGATIFVSEIRLRKACDTFFPFLLASATFSLLLSVTLTSAYVPNLDIAQEFALFQQVVQVGTWNPGSGLLYNSALSVTILPVVIGAVSSIDGTVVFKIVFPAMFSIVPMMLYKIYRNMMSPRAAFLSVFVFLIYPTTYTEIASLGRQMIAEVIIVLLFWILLTQRLKRSRRGAFLTVLLTTGLVISHYSTAIVYLFLIAAAYVFSVMVRPRTEGRFGGANLIGLSFVTALAWFFLAAGGIVLRDLISAFSNVQKGLADFFNTGSVGRSFLVYSAVGATPVNFEVLHLANRLIQYVVVLCILIGFVACIRKSTRFRNGTIVPVMVPSMLLLGSAVTLPYLSGTVGLTRIYQLSLLSLAPCFYFGAAAINHVISNHFQVFTRARHIKIKKMIPAVILFTYLIFTSGWMWAVTLDTPTSQALDFQRMAQSPVSTLRYEHYVYYIVAPDFLAARWLVSQGIGGKLLCADAEAKHGVLAIAGVNATGPYLLTNAWPKCQLGDYAYVSVMNSVTGIGTSPGSSLALGEASGHESYYLWPINATISELDNQNRIYSDGATIYQISNGPSSTFGH